MVVVENERIVAVGSDDDVKTPNGATVVDAGDGYVSPGFIDIHTHGGAGSDYMDGTPDAARIVNRAHARHGTTTIFPTTTTGTPEQLAAMLDAVEEVARDWKVEDGARIAGVHWYGPYFAADKVGAHPKGHPANLVPPEYAGGLGDEGLAALNAFVQAGGTLICLDQAGELAINAFQLPIRDVAREAPVDQFYCPGSILRIDLDPSDPLSYGMQTHTAGFFSFSSAYEVDGAASTIRTAARYGTSNLLLSGWLEGESVIAGRSAVVQATVGAGQVVLLGFRVQHRGQSLATFRLLFNSIFTAR